jgi:hypothetical protein
VKINYIKDKETKGTIRFTPEDPDIIGVATIYLPKPVIRQLKIDPVKGFTMTLEPRP